MSIENFISAFSSCSSGCRRECHCGKTFYDWCGHWGWEAGELESLSADPKAIGLDHSVGTIIYGPREYVIDCDCWRKESYGGLRIMAWLDDNAHAIAQYLTLEKQRKQREADDSPVVEDPVIVPGVMLK